jgi:peptidoglycan/xylan/chitin deacetylase (PgdA/CDA1 family)
VGSRLLTLLGTRGRRPYRYEQPGALLDDFSNLVPWDPTGGTVAADTTYVITGTQSAKLTSDAVGSNVNIRRSGMSVDLSAGNRISLWVYTPIAESTLTDIKTATVYLWSGSAWVNQARGLRPGWNKIDLDPYPSGTWAAGGGELDFATGPLTSVTIRINKQDYEQSIVAYVDCLTNNSRSRPKCVLSFDDGLVTQYTELFPRMAAYGFKGTLYVITDNIDGAGALSMAQLTEMYNAGWDVSNHTMTHPTLTELTSEQVQTEVAGARDWLASHGFTRRNCHLHFCYPGSIWDIAVMSDIETAGMLSGRATASVVQGNALDSPLLLRSQLVDDKSVAAVTDIVDTAIRRGGTAMLYGHAVGGVSWAAENYDALLAYLHSKRNEIDVITMSEWYDWITKRPEALWLPT